MAMPRITMEELKKNIIDIYEYHGGTYWIGPFDMEGSVRTRSNFSGTVIVFEFKIRYNTYSIKKTTIVVRPEDETLTLTMQDTVTKHYVIDEMEFTLEDESLQTLYGILMGQKAVLSLLNLQIA